MSFAQKHGAKAYNIGAISAVKHHRRIIIGRLAHKRLKQINVSSSRLGKKIGNGITNQRNAIIHAPLGPLF